VTQEVSSMTVTDTPPPEVGGTGDRRWMPAVVAALVVAIVAGTSFAAWQREDGGPSGSAVADDGRGSSAGDAGATDPGATDPGATDPGATDPAFREVAWHGVAVEVPIDWSDATAPGSDWCAFDQGPGKPPFPTGPYVARDTSYAGVLSIGCLADSDAPAAFGDVPVRYWAPHVWFELTEPRSADPAATYRNWTLTSRTVDGVRVNVLADGSTSELAEKILASAVVVQTDAHGCETTSPVQATRFVRPEPAFDVTRLGSVDSISVCQYDRSAGTTAPGLLGSRVLEGDEASDVLAAIRAAPAGGGPDAPQHCVDDLYGDTALALRLHDDDTPHDVYVYYDWCFGNGFDDGTTRRELTRAACLPLWGGRVQLWGGSSEPFSRCHD
jgi:hypothetical protein